MDVIRLRTWMLCSQDGLGHGRHDVFWARMLCSQNALDHGRHEGLGMDALAS